MKMRKRKPKLIYAECRRGCGKELASLAKPIYSTHAVQAKFQFICTDCMTVEERNELISHYGVAQA